MTSKIVLNHANTQCMLIICSLLLIRQITILVNDLTGIFNQSRILKSQKTTAVGILSAPAEQLNQHQEQHDSFIANMEDLKLKIARDKEGQIVF